MPKLRATKIKGSTVLSRIQVS